MTLAVAIWVVVLTAAGAISVSHLGGRSPLLDRPNHRSSHQRPTPKGGAAGMLVAFAAAAIGLDIPVGIWLPVAAVAMVGFVGDFLDISPRVRLLLHFCASGMLVFGAHLCGAADAAPASLAAGVAWMVFIVGTANFYNFMDGIDGIAAITGIVGFGLVSVFSARFGGGALQSVSLAMALACAVFLPFNFPRAMVFMGDVGSILLGFLFGALVFCLARDLADFLCLTAFLFPFYADELTTMGIRLRNGEQLLRPHRKHLYQLLANEMRFPHWQVSMGYGLLQAAIGTAALAVLPLGAAALLALLIALFAGYAAVSFQLRSTLDRPAP
jgi:Fuc2NAc and GlcNAc transferase